MVSGRGSARHGMPLLCALSVCVCAPHWRMHATAPRFCRMRRSRAPHIQTIISERGRWKHQPELPLSFPGVPGKSLNDCTPWVPAPPFLTSPGAVLGLPRVSTFRAHATITTNARTLIARIASADLKKKNGGGTIAALTAARATAHAAEATADAARQAGLPTHRELEVFAKKKRAAVHTAHTCGYDIAAAAAGHTFYPAGFTEFAGWSASAKAILPAITHKGDALMADEEGDRFDAGAEGTWATRKHRSFLIHSVAAAAARALFRAVAIPRARTAASAALPRRLSPPTLTSPSSTARTSVAAATPPCATFCRPRKLRRLRPHMDHNRISYRKKNLILFLTVYMYIAHSVCCL